ncbi:ABC transporter ATP-binding protein [Candidatus Aerophobetes bacterium]|nr:ABC transporter ATP-binding protein [Candidatus Aerophobetes bacterium]
MKTFLRILSYTKPYRGKLIAAFIAAGGVTGLGLIPPYLVKIIIDEIITKKNLHLFPIIMGMLLFAYILRSTLISFRILLNNKVQQRLIFDLRNQVYHSLQRLSLSYFEGKETGKIVSRIINDVEALQAIVTSGLTTLFVAFITLTGSLIILIRMNLKLTLIAMIPLPLLAFLIFKFSGKAHRSYRQVRRKLAKVTALLQENIFGIREIKTFTQEEYEEKKFAIQGRGYFRSNMRIAKLWSIYYPLILFISSLGTILVLFFGTKEILAGTLTIGSLVAFYGYLGLFYQPIDQLNQVNNMFQHARAAGERVFDIIDTIPEVKEAKDAISFSSPVKGAVEFNNVCFTYNKKDYVLHNINLKVKPGEKIAIVGPSGSGKTTLISLIPRFYDVTKGSITIDGYDIRKLKLSYLREQIAIVLQEPFLFNESLKNNIGFSKRGATNEEIIAAAKIANADEFIKKLPAGYETKAGERGNNLSLGQKQRISIARAVLKNPSILILDEATSSVDTEVEALIQEALERLMKNRTSFIIAHRLSTIRNADRIVVMDQGRIVEIGTHRELLRHGGLYSHLYKVQFKPQNIKEELPILTGLAN